MPPGAARIAELLLVVDERHLIQTSGTASRADAAELFGHQRSVDAAADAHRATSADERRVHQIIGGLHAGKLPHTA